MEASLLDQFTPETLARLTPEQILAIQNNQQIADRAKEMRPINSGDDPRVFTAPNPGLKYPCIRYHKATGEHRIFKTEAEEKANPEYVKVGPTIMKAPKVQMSKAEVDELERLEEENEELQRRLQEAETPKSKR